MIQTNYLIDTARGDITNLGGLKHGDIWWILIGKTKTGKYVLIRPVIYENIYNTDSKLILNNETYSIEIYKIIKADFDKVCDRFQKENRDM